MNWTKTLSSCLFFILGISANAQYPIIPKPLIETVRTDFFTFSANHPIENYSRDSNLNASFNAWLNNDASKKIVPNKMVQTKISLQLLGQKKWKKYLQKLQLNSSFEPGNEGYVIKIEKNYLLLLAQTETGLFYGFQSIQQLFKMGAIPCGEIYDKPAFAIRAWQDDISRGPIPTMRQLKNEIKLLSSYKLNYFTLYTEHVFKYKTHPAIALEEGITANDIQELQQFAKLYHVQLIANQQSFGHLEKILANPAYAYLGEKNHILSPNQSASYQMLNDFYTEQNACYDGKYFMINCDETFGLGSEQNKRMADSLGMAGLYAYHINKIYSLLKPSGKQILMWSDIIANYPEIKNKIPKDIILIPWAYHDAKSFEDMLKPISEAGFNFWVAPGINNWLNVFPNQNIAQNNCYNLIRDGYQLGASGVLNTSWDDDGYSLFENNWQGFIWGADLSWNAPLAYSNSFDRYNRFKKAYDIQFWGTPISDMVNQFSDLHQSKINKCLSNQSFFEPIFPMFPSYLSNDAEQNNKQAQQQLTRIYKQIDSLLNFAQAQQNAAANLKYAIREAQFTIEKNIFRIHYNKFLHQEYTKENIELELQQLQQKVANLQSDFSYLYLQENKNYWLQNNLVKFESLKKTLQLLPEHCVIVADEKLTAKGRKITLSAPLSSNPIYYTTDSLAPFKPSRLYSKPFYLKSNATIQCATFANLNTKNEISLSKETFIFHQAIGKIMSINIPYSKYHPAYAGGGPMGLADGKIGSAKTITDGNWQGYTGKDLIVVMAFDKVVKMKSFEMGFYQNTTSWVILPKQLEIYVSENGEQYQLLNTISHQIPVNSEEKIKYIFNASYKNQKVQFIKIVCKYYGPLPSFHPSAGEASMIFADEIIIR